MKFMFALALLVVGQGANAQGFVHDWSRHMGGALLLPWCGAGIARDNGGNVYVAGEFRDTVDFGGGPVTSAGMNDIYIAKFTSNGEHIWSRRFGSPVDDGCVGVAVDAAGSATITGFFRQTLDFGGGPHVSAGSLDAFVVQFDADGNYVWGRLFGNVDEDYGRAIAADDVGNVIVSGVTRGTVDFGGGPVTGGFGYELFIVMYDSSGDVVWNRRIPTDAIEAAEACAIDGEGCVLLTGYFYGSINFGAGSLHSRGVEDVFVVKYDGAGNHLWSRAYGGNYADQARGIAVDDSMNVYVTGRFSGGQVEFCDQMVGAGGDDIFVLKLDRDGNCLWNRRFGGPGVDRGHGIDVDSVGRLFLTGKISYYVDFGGGPLGYAYSGDIFIAAFGPNGEHLASSRFGDSGVDEGYAILTEGSGGVIATGFYQWRVDFGGGPLQQTTYQSGFLAKYELPAANRDPVALCQDVVAHADGACLAGASIDGGSYDPDGDPITLTQTPTGPYPLGMTLVTLTVEDDKGGIATCIGTVTVDDVTPPQISVELNRDVLWPPNHKMVDITAEVTVTDNCCATPTFKLVSITSNEPDNGKGDGNTVGDVQGVELGTPDEAFQLRSERSGRGDGRVYTIVYTAEDCAGNTAEATATVHVPHDRAGIAFASTGYTDDGSAIDASMESFVVIIPSTGPRFDTDEEGNGIVVAGRVDATRLDPGKIYVGNTAGVVTPFRRMKLDNNGDGLFDLALFYSSEATRALVTNASTTTEDKLDIDGEGVDGPVGLHYTDVGGVDYLVRNIFELGTPVPLALPAEGNRKSYERDSANQDQQAATQRANALLPGYPNPFNPTTTIPFEVAREGRVSVRIFDTGGKLVRNLCEEVLPAGVHELEWDGRDNRGRRVATGVYFVRFATGDFEATNRLVMIK